MDIKSEPSYCVDCGEDYDLSSVNASSDVCGVCNEKDLIK